MKYEKLELDIGTKIFTVHKNYVDKKLSGGRIKVCKVKTFMNRRHKIIPIFTEIGNTKRELTPETEYIYTNLNKAIKAITTKK